MIVGIVCRGTTYFLEPLINHWRSRGWKFVHSLEADVVWVEWANEQSIAATRTAPEKNVIVRMLGSEYYQRFWEQWGDKLSALIQTNPVHEIPGVDGIHIPQPIDTNFWNCSSKRKGRKIAMVGNYLYRKNHLGLIRMLVEQPQYFDEVIFIGDMAPQNAYLHVEVETVLYTIIKLAEKYSIKLTVLGKRSPEQIRDIYNEVDFVVSSSFNESGSP